MRNPVTYAFQVIVLAVWLTCAGVSVTGLGLGWPPPPVKKAEPPAVQAVFIDTLLKDEPPQAVATPEQNLPPSTQDDPPPPPDLPDLPPLPELPAFVEKAIKPEQQPFAPVKTDKPKPPRPVASHSSSTNTIQPSGKPGVQNLTMGQGEGRQPRPPYPSSALSRRQEGTVIIQLLVGADGNVTSAEVWQPSAWPLLNESALETVRGRWHFPSGPVRLYRVPIRFHIQ